MTTNTLQSGGPMTIRWQTRNDGNAVVNTSFSERIVIANGTQTLLNTTIPYDATGTGAIAIGAAVARNYVFTLPDGVSGAGSLTITITTDSSNAVVEGFSGTPAENNNSSAGIFTSQLRRYPDLFVGLLSVIQQRRNRTIDKSHVANGQYWQ